VVWRKWYWQYEGNVSLVKLFSTTGLQQTLTSLDTKSNSGKSNILMWITTAQAIRLYDNPLSLSHLANNFYAYACHFFLFTCHVTAPSILKFRVSNSPFSETSLWPSWKLFSLGNRDDFCRHALPTLIYIKRTIWTSACITVRVDDMSWSQPLKKRREIQEWRQVTYCSTHNNKRQVSVVLLLYSVSSSEGQNVSNRVDNSVLFMCKILLQWRNGETPALLSVLPPIDAKVWRTWWCR
jgi:hypothetical protein